MCERGGMCTLSVCVCVQVFNVFYPKQPPLADTAGPQLLHTFGRLLHLLALIYPTNIPQKGGRTLMVINLDLAPGLISCTQV